MMMDDPKKPGGYLRHFRMKRAGDRKLCQRKGDKGQERPSGGHAEPADLVAIVMMHATQEQRDRQQQSHAQEQDSVACSNVHNENSYP